MQESVKVTFLANAGVLLEYRGVKLLIDGIYDERGHCFSNLSAEQWEDLKAGKGAFAQIDYLLFTHGHGDHFSPRRVLEYLEQQRPKAIFLPMRGSVELNLLRKKIEEKKIPCVLLDASTCKNTVFRPKEDIHIRVLPTRHLDRIYWDVPHFCYFLELGEKKLLFTADVDFTWESFPQLRDVKLDAVFVNPLLMHSKEGRKLLTEGALRAKWRIVYHIPFLGEDQMGIRALAEQQLRGGKAERERTIYLMEAGQSCML